MTQQLMFVWPLSPEKFVVTFALALRLHRADWSEMSLIEGNAGRRRGNSALYLRNAMWYESPCFKGYSIACLVGGKRRRLWKKIDKRMYWKKHEKVVQNNMKIHGERSWRKEYCTLACERDCGAMNRNTQWSMSNKSEMSQQKQKFTSVSHIPPTDMSNSIETAIAIAFFGTIAIGIAIAKAIFQLLLLILLREFFNYCYWYC